MKRRNFVKDAVSGAAATAALYSAANIEGCKPFQGTGSTDTSGREALSGHVYNGPYSGEYLNRPAFPLGGMGAGMICIEGTGALSHFSLRNEPDIFNEPCVFAAVCVKGDPNVARVLEGPVPRWKAFGNPDTGNGAGGKTYGLPRFASAEFQARFPFATVRLTDDKVPLEVQLVAWSTFTPGDADNSSLPAAALEYTFINKSQNALQAVFSFNSRNFMADVRNAIRGMRQPNTGCAISRADSCSRGQFAGKTARQGSFLRFRGGQGNQSRLPLVPRRLVGSADYRLETCRTRGSNREPAVHRGPAKPRRQPLCPVHSACRRRKENNPPFYLVRSPLRDAAGRRPQAEKSKTCAGGECKNLQVLVCSEIR